MNLTVAIILEQVELEVRMFQRILEKSLIFTNKVRRLEKCANILDKTKSQNTTNLGCETKSN